MRRSVWLPLFGIFLMIAFGFQNCAPRPQMEFEDLESTAEREFFAYPYKKAPLFYGDLFLFQKASDIESLQAFSFVGMGAYLPDPEATVDYKVTVIDPSNPTPPVCVTQEGSLETGHSEIQFECVTSSDRVPEKVRVTLTLTAEGNSHTIQRDFTR